MDRRYQSTKQRRRFGLMIRPLGRTSFESILLVRWLSLLSSYMDCAKYRYSSGTHAEP